MYLSTSMYAFIHICIGIRAGPIRAGSGLARHGYGGFAWPGLARPGRLACSNACQLLQTLPQLLGCPAGRPLCRPPGRPVSRSNQTAESRPVRFLKCYTPNRYFIYFSCWKCLACSKRCFNITCFQDLACYTPTCQRQSPFQCYTPSHFAPQLHAKPRYITVYICIYICLWTFINQ